MELICSLKEKNIWLENYSADRQLSLKFKGEPFVCALWNGKNNFQAENIIEQIIKANCKYFITGGKNCEELHDTVDEGIVELLVCQNLTDFQDVVTTWHTDQKFEDVIYFMLNNTNFDDYKFSNYLILQIGTEFSEKEIAEIVSKILVLKSNP